mmetsp:Transcript_36918/g.72488  ORF Transcript_36918/g.72488 Transcript_36918/m.72488 type:complete len:235 (-) Transcript_36918:816-1520(-)
MEHLDTNLELAWLFQEEVGDDISGSVRFYSRVVVCEQQHSRTESLHVALGVRCPPGVDKAAVETLDRDCRFLVLPPCPFDLHQLLGFFGPMAKDSAGLDNPEPVAVQRVEGLCSSLSLYAFHVLQLPLLSVLCLCQYSLGVFFEDLCLAVVVGFQHSLVTLLPRHFVALPGYRSPLRDALHVSVDQVAVHNLLQVLCRRRLSGRAADPRTKVRIPAQLVNLSFDLGSDVALPLY